jgi:glycosyltransferase involved in cell wall biosynthesis
MTEAKHIIKPRQAAVIIPSYGYGGAENYALKLAAHWQSIGWDVCCVLPAVHGAPELLAEAKKRGLNFAEVDFLEVFPHRLRMSLRRLPGLFFKSFSLARWLRKNRIDVGYTVHPAVNTGLSAMLGMAFGNVSSFSVFQMVGGRPFSPRSFTRFIYDFSFRRLTHAIAVSENNAALLREEFQFLDGQLVVIQNGSRSVSANVLAARDQLRAEFLRKHSLSSQTQLVLTAGRLAVQKGHRYLVEILPQLCAKFPQAYFVWAGEGELRDELETLLRKSGVRERVIMLGHVSEIHELYAISDLFLLPSLFEGQPLSISEAMSAGLPVVSTTASGIAEIIIDGQHGLLCEPGNPSALFEIVETALEDPVRMVALAAAAKQRYELFSEDKMLKDTTVLVDTPRRQLDL